MSIGIQSYLLRFFIGRVFASGAWERFSIPAKPGFARVCARSPSPRPPVLPRIRPGIGEIFLTARVESEKIMTLKGGEELSWERTTFATWGSRVQSPSPPPSFSLRTRDGDRRRVCEGGCPVSGRSTIVSHPPGFLPVPWKSLRKREPAT